MAQGDGSNPINGAQTSASEAKSASIPAGAVFISYASQDAAIAGALVEALERHGIPCWIAPRDVRPGDFYADAIVNAINACPVLLLVLSKNSVDSAHVLREVERASAKKRPIIAFRIDATPLPTGLEYFLSASQWIDASAGSPERGFPKLVEAIRSRISSTPKAESERPTVRPLAKRSLNRIIIVVATVVTAALVYFIADRFWLSKHASSQQVTTTATNVVSEKSIAVLPFTDMSEKKDQEYFADGMAEEVLDLLAQIPGLHVIGRISSFQFKGKNDDLRTIGAQLGVAHLLQGSVRRSGSALRVTAVLVRVTDGATEWSESYDNSLDDVLKVQDAIAVSIARALEISIGDSIIAAPRPVNPAAYDLYLKGAHAFDLFTRQGCEEAIGLFTQALQIDPKFAPAAVGIAWSYDRIGQNGWMPTPLAYQRAREYALRSLEIDPKLAAAHTVLAGIKLVYDWDWRGAREEIDKAFALGGRNSAGLAVAGRVASATNPGSDEALAFLRESTALDPLNAEAHIVLGYWVYARTGRFADAERAMRRGLQINPKWGSGHYFLAIDLIMLGRLDEAMEEANKETTEDGRFEALADIYYAQHRKAESDAALREAITANADNWAGAIALAYAFRGEASEALRWLERSYAQHDEELYLIKGDPQLRSLESDTRYKAFLRKMNLPE